MSDREDIEREVEERVRAVLSEHRIAVLEAEKRAKAKLIGAVLAAAAAIAAGLVGIGAARERVNQRLEVLERNQTELRAQVWNHLVGVHP